MSIKYIAGRPLKMGDKTVWPGEEVNGADFFYLEAFLSSGHIYAVTPDKGYSSLPPHVFSAVMTRKEAEAKIAGDPGIKGLDVDAHKAHTDSQVVREAEAQALISREGPTAPANVLGKTVSAEKAKVLEEALKIRNPEPAPEPVAAKPAETKAPAKPSGRLTQSTTKKPAAKKG